MAGGRCGYGRAARRGGGDRRIPDPDSASAGRRPRQRGLRQFSGGRKGGYARHWRRDTEVLVFEQMRVPRWLAETVIRAAQVTNVDPAYLMALADKESSLVPESKAATSSAEG